MKTGSDYNLTATNYVNLESNLNRSPVVIEYVEFEFNYRLYSGQVKSKHNYGTEQKPIWYVEFFDERRGYMYVKQDIDGMEDVQFNFKSIRK